MSDETTPPPIPRRVTVWYYGHEHYPRSVSGKELAVGSTGITLGIDGELKNGTTYTYTRFFPWSAVQSVDTEYVVTKLPE